MQNSNYSYKQVRIAVIGGGAAGMMAAGTAVMYGADVTIFESTDRLGKKLAITGKGRCNVTNNSTTEEFLNAVSPEVCVVSCGVNNSYGHPSNVVVSRIEEYGATLHRTDEEGTVVIRGEK